MVAAVALTDVTKTFGGTTAVSRLSLTIPVGALYGFIGPNGAGKTTTIRMLMSILFPDTGQLKILGHASALEAKDRIGYLPEERGVYKNMKVAAYLRFIARLKGVDERSIGARIDSLLERVELPEVGGKPCEELSKGMRQKIQFAAAIINEPDLLILDEPFSGLDPVNMRLLRDLIVAEHVRGATILFSTHVMPQAEEICDHVIMMHRGHKVLDDPVSTIRGQYDTGTLLVEPVTPAEGRSALTAIAGVGTVIDRGEVFELHLTAAARPEQVMQAVTAALPVVRLEIKRPRLEDVFIRLVAGESGAAADALAAELDAPARAGGEP
jgi:ABC-2 type transport system ATP-binding protein